MPTDKEFKEQLKKVRAALRRADEAWLQARLGALGDGRNLSDVYAEAETAQHEAFELKQLFAWVAFSGRLYPYANTASSRAT